MAYKGQVVAGLLAGTCIFSIIALILSVVNVKDFFLPPGSKVGPLGGTATTPCLGAGRIVPGSAQGLSLRWPKVPQAWQRSVHAAPMALPSLRASAGAGGCSARAVPALLTLFGHLRATRTLVSPEPLGGPQTLDALTPESLPNHLGPLGCWVPCGHLPSLLAAPWCSLGCPLCPLDALTPDSPPKSPRSPWVLGAP